MKSENEQRLVSVEIQKEFDVINKHWQDRIFVKLYTAARTSGFLANISDRNWKTLCVLATFMDSQGNCYPSQEEIANALGVCRQAANERVNKLLEYRWQGKPIMIMVKHRKEVDTGKKGQRWDNNSYTILPLSNISFGNKNESEPLKTSEKSTENPMSSNHDTGKNLDITEEKPMSPYPDTGKDDTNKIYKYVVVDRARTREENQVDGKDIQKAKGDSSDKVREIQEIARSSFNTDLPGEYVLGLLKNFSAERIKEKINIIGSGTGWIKNLPGLLLSALRRDFVDIPAKPVKEALPKNKNKIGRAGSNNGYNGQNCEPSNQRDVNRKKELIKRLYLS